MKKRLIQLAVLVLWVNLFFDVGWNAITWYVFTVGLVGWAWWVTKPRIAKSTVWIWGVIGVLLLGGLVRVSPFNQFLAWVGIVVAAGLLVYLQLMELPIVRNVAELALAPFRLLVGYIAGGLRFLLELFNWKPSGKLSDSQLKTIVVGGGFGAIAVLLIGGLLASGDAVFGTTVERFLHFQISDQLGARLLASAVVTAVAIPALMLKLSRKFDSPFGLWQRIMGEREALVGVLMVAGLFGLFLLLQWPYIFASVPAETSLVKFGVATYSEYVRKGFGELVLAGLVGYGVAGLVYMSFRGGKWLRIGQLILLTELGVFAVSILRRVWLYQSFHGWSLIRLYGAFVVAWTLGMLATLAVRHFKRWHWVRLEVGMTVAFLVFAVWFNAESFVAQSHPPTVNGRVDYTYLVRLSGDGVDGWIAAYWHAKNFLSDELMRKPFLDAEDRRELVYANRIVKSLTGHYLELVSKYASKEEYVGYTAEVESAYNLSKDRWFALPDPIRQQQLSDPYQKISQGCFSVMSDWAVDEFSNRRPIKFYENWCSQENKHEPWILHPGGKAVFQKFNMAVGLAGIHELQDRVEQLYYRVYLQPDAERTVQLDISSESPLLDF